MSGETCQNVLSGGHKEVFMSQSDTGDTCSGRGQDTWTGKKEDWTSKLRLSDRQRQTQEQTARQTDRQVNRQTNSKKDKINYKL